MQQIISKIRDDLEVVLLRSYFVGHPVYKYNMAVNNKALEIGKWKYNDQEFTKCFRAIYL